MNIVYAEEYLYPEQEVAAKITVQCGSHTTTHDDKVKIKMHTYSAPQSEFYSPRPPFTCSTTEKKCMENVRRNDLLKDKYKVGDDFYKCFEEDIMKGIYSKSVKLTLKGKMIMNLKV